VLQDSNIITQLNKVPKTPSYAHSAMVRAKDLLCCGLRKGLRSVSLSFGIFVVYIPLWGGRTVNKKQTNNKVPKPHPVKAKHAVALGMNAGTN
jgi:hypothetical protein